MEKKKSIFQLPNRPDIIRVSVKDHLCIADVMFEPCVKTGRIFFHKLSEADRIENITTACIQHIYDKVICNCVTNCCVLFVHNQAGALYCNTNSQNLCIHFPSVSFALHISFNMWFRLTCMLYLNFSFISLQFLLELDTLIFFLSTWFSCEFYVPSYATFFKRNFS